jgi:hypothetical protein
MGNVGYVTDGRGLNLFFLHSFFLSLLYLPLSSYASRLYSETYHEPHNKSKSFALMTATRIHMFVLLKTEVLELCNYQNVLCNVVKFAADVILEKCNDTSAFQRLL